MVSIKKSKKKKERYYIIKYICLHIIKRCTRSYILYIMIKNSKRDSRLLKMLIIQFIIILLLLLFASRNITDTCRYLNNMYVYIS